MAIDFNRMRECLRTFNFQELFVSELGWSMPTSRKPIPFDVKGEGFKRQQIAQLAGAVVFEVTADSGTIPDARTRAAVHKEVFSQHYENILIFLDTARTQSLWYWVKRETGKNYPRDHLYVKGQPGDLFVSKLGQIVFDISELDEEGNAGIVEVATRIRKALDVERVTKRFYGNFQEQHLAFIELIQGVSDERQRRWYASVLLNRLMFIYFLQRKGFLDNGDLDYLQKKLAQSKLSGKNLFFNGFLKLLFFEGFAKPEEKRSAAARKVLGSIKYLNGGLFLPHHVEQDNPKLDVPDKAFENLFALFARYSWNLNDTPGGKDDEINPDVLGYIFEKYINQKAFGAYYTRPEITEYLCERTIHRLVLEAINSPDAVRRNPPKGVKVRQYDSLADLLLDLDASVCKQLLHEVLPGLSLLDPACGSGAFLVAAMRTLINVYAAVIGKVKFLNDRNLSEWLRKIERDHPNVGYFIKKAIITDNLFGVDIMEEAVEIAKLRLFLALVAAAETVDQLEPLPNIDFNILPGNSLIGLMRVDDKEFERRNAQGNLFRKSYKQILEEKNRLIENYRHAAAYAEDLAAIRDEIDQRKQQAAETLNDILLDEFKTLGIKYEQATWDSKANKEGKPEKRLLKPKDMDALRPFHWGFEFDAILHGRGGFDAIITNPPWEIFKPNAKEFFEEYSELVSKKKMTIHDFEEQQAKLLKDGDTREAWLDYLSQFPHQSAYYRSVPQYRNQISIVNGKKAGTDINLYKLFVEQCFNLLREGGRCGIITPGGVYTDLGSKQLREMLFTQGEVGSLFGLSNEKFIFEGVHHAQKFCLLVFKKGGRTDNFEAAFRINPREAVAQDRLDQFLNSPTEHLWIPAALVRRLSPDSLSIMEFKCDLDVAISEKTLRFPLLGETLDDTWNIKFCREFDMTQGDGSEQVSSSARANLEPLFEGKMIWHFDSHYAEPHFWINRKRLRTYLFGDEKGVIDADLYRTVLRRQSASTNERTLVTTVIPPAFHADNLASVRLVDKNGERLDSSKDQLFVCAVLNSLCLDYVVRHRVTNNLNFFYLYQLPVPRGHTTDACCSMIVHRSARLICTTPEYDALAKAVGLKNHRDGVTDPTGRAKLRAELDGLIAHFYGLTEEEFAHVLSTFPLVPDPAKVAAQNAYRDVERGLIR